MPEYIEIDEPMISAKDLLEKWPKMLDCDLAECIERSKNQEYDFPTAYIVWKVVKDDTGKKVNYCTCYSHNKTILERLYARSPYTVSDEGGKLIYDFGNTAFIFAEVERFEHNYPDVLHTRLTLKEAWGAFSSPEGHKHIEAWQAILPKLRKKAEIIAAKLAIQKWQRKSHKEACEAVRSGEDVTDFYSYVSKKKKLAEKLAKQYGLTMPDWQVKK